MKKVGSNSGIHKWMNKQNVIYTYNDVLLSLKRDENSTRGAWMNLEDIMFGEVSQPRKDKYYILAIISGTQSSEIHREIMWNGDHQGLRGGEKHELLSNGYGVSVAEGENILDMDGDDSCTTKKMHLLPLNCVLTNCYNP